ncbi:hypothetical protein [Plesiomonas shigelloides]|jgi:hypothetical protein|uniref:hypothetical protein n=1 Tax=Plesiomonas shigelloides TaxID=703 RepID=UPI000A1210BB|nr:hypothetical protein [Plesiomonas shigelloides]KAB7697955.1 hypothetical protein GBN33_10520 [Plesiomonas shigelloides]KAB7698134.1 hypothetical protein GBN26_13945 [Plesiomonas shigelloides]QIY07684.1 hypothetical protein FOC33_01265 [Plesiomonas shigelloides]SUB63818.1 Uncharacterised protein [Plesiomonas shigelloides]
MNNSINDVKLMLGKLVKVVTIIDGIDASLVSKDAVLEVYRLNEVLMDEIAMLNDPALTKVEKSQMIGKVIDMRVIISGVMNKLGIR